MWFEALPVFQEFLALHLIGAGVFLTAPQISAKVKKRNIDVQRPQNYSFLARERARERVVAREMTRATQNLSGKNTIAMLNISRWKATLTVYKWSRAH